MNAGLRSALNMTVLGVGFTSTTVSVAQMFGNAVPDLAYAPLLFAAVFGYMTARDGRAEESDDRADGEVVTEVTP